MKNYKKEVEPLLDEESVEKEVMKYLKYQNPTNLKISIEDDNYNIYYENELKYSIPEIDFISIYNKMVKKMNDIAYDYIKSVQFKCNNNIPYEKLTERYNRYIKDRKPIFTLLDKNLTKREKEDIELYLNLSHIIYILPNEHNFDINQVKDCHPLLNKIIDPYDDIKSQIEVWKFNLEKYNGLINNDYKIVLKSFSDPKLVNMNEIFSNFNIILKKHVQTTNNNLEKHNFKKIEIDSQNIDPSHILSYLREIFSSIHQKYKESFEENGVKENAHKIITYFYKDKTYFLTQRFANIISFLYIKGLKKYFPFKDFENENIFQISFRNNIEEYPNFLPKIFAKIVKAVKENKFSKFKEGELDFIAILDDKDKNHLKFTIVFSGSNSEEDWKNNIDFPHSHTKLGYSIHEGIYKLWDSYSHKSLDLLLLKIESLLKNSNYKPKIIEIVFTGHSLGGALGLLSHLYLSQILKKNFEGIEFILKSFLYATPAIFGINDADKVEKELSNIYHIHTKDDPVVVYTQEIFKIKIAKHIGINFVLENLTNLDTVSYITNYPYHLIEAYISLLKANFYNPLFEDENFKTLMKFKEIHFQFRNLMFLKKHIDIKQETFIDNNSIDVLQTFIPKISQVTLINITQQNNNYIIPNIDIFEYKSCPLLISKSNPSNIFEKISKIGAKKILQIDYSINQVYQDIESEKDEVLNNFYHGYLNFVLEKYKESLCYLEKAQNYPLSQLIIGECYLNGFGTEKNENLAFKYFECINEFPNTQYVLGFCYLKGKGVEKNLEKSLTYLNQTDYSNSLFYKGYYYYYMNNDHEKALGYFQNSKENSKSQCLLGNYYENKKMNNEAYNWYLKSYEQNYTIGIRFLAYCYKNGKGCSKNEKLFFETLQKAANLGSIEAQKDLKTCQIFEIGTKK